MRITRKKKYHKCKLSIIKSRVPKEINISDIWEDVGMYVHDLMEDIDAIKDKKPTSPEEYYI